MSQFQGICRFLDQMTRLSQNRISSLAIIYEAIVRLNQTLIQLQLLLMTSKTIQIDTLVTLIIKRRKDLLRIIQLILF